MWTPKRILIYLIALIGFMAVFGVVVTVFGWVDGLPILPPHYAPSADRTAPTEDDGPGFGDNVRDVKIRQAFGGKECEESKRLSKVFLASKGAVLAINKYDIEKDGRVKMTPFSLGLFAKNKADQRFPEITTVQCNVAFVRLDRPITSLADLSRSKVVAVELGEPGDTIKIKNNRGTQELNDDLELRVKERPLYYEDARNLIWSYGIVELIDTQSQPEPMRVTAIGLRVDLSKDASPNRDKKTAAAKKSGGISGVEKITLPANVDMHLYVDPRSGFMAGPDELAKKPPAKVDPKDKAHVHIKTNGPFVYDLVNKSARFDAPEKTALVHDRVIVTRHLNLPGPKGGLFTDLLDCDRLDLKFRDKDAAKPGSNDMEIQSAIATAKPGSDVELHLESEVMEAFGAEMRYFAATPTTGPQTIVKGGPMRALRQGHQIECEELHLTGADKFGKGQEAFAKGPGKIDLLDKQTGRLSTHILFQKSFAATDDVDGDRAYKLLTVRGDAAYIDEERKQELRAAQFLNVWIAETKVEPAPLSGAAPENSAKKVDAAGGRRHQPHKIEAFEKVLLRSPQLNILETNRLTVFFREKPGELVEKAVPEKARDGVPALAANGRPVAEATPVALPKNANESAPNGALMAPVTKSAPSFKGESEKAKKPLEMTARKITADVAMIGNTNELLEFLADGAVHVTQRADNPKDKGLDITGNMLRLVRHARGDTLEVIGDPQKIAQLQFNEMLLWGPKVTIDQVSNIAQVDGNGAMRMPSSTTLDGKRKDGHIEIHWNKSMLFTGRLAEFKGGVLALQGNGKMQAHEMQVKLDKPVYFKQTKDGQTAKVDQIVCYRDSRSKDDLVGIQEVERLPNNKLLTYRRLFLTTVDVNNPDQCLDGSGPGVLDFIGRSSANDHGIGPAAQAPADGPKKKGDDGVAKWTRVRFQGNIKSWVTAGGGRQTSFTDDVQVFHQPGENPDVKDPEALGKDGLALHCQKLTVIQRKVGDKTSQEMIAGGSTSLVNFWTQQFKGFARTLKYDESNDTIVFDGDVTIFEIPKIRGAVPREIRGRQVLYNRKSGEFHVDGSPGIQWAW